MIKIIISFLSFLFISLLTVSPVIAAETDVIKKTSIETFSMMNALNMFMGLAVVIALILGLAWVLKKYGRLPSNNMVDMKVLGGLSLGTREKAVLIEVENTRLLIGVTPGHIQTLHVLGNNKETPASFDETLNKQISSAQQSQLDEYKNA